MGGHCSQDPGPIDFIAARNEYYPALRDNASQSHCDLESIPEVSGAQASVGNRRRRCACKQRKAAG